MLVADRDYVRSKYDLTKLKGIEDLVANAVEIHVPFNNYITGFCAFTHKAGIHAKAILANPTTYEIINPADFGMTRYVHFASRLTGWNAIKSRVEQLKLEMTDDQIKSCTASIKAMADVKQLAIEDTDEIIKKFFQNLKAKDEDAQPLLDDLTPKEQAAFAEKERELAVEPDAQQLNRVVEQQSDIMATNGVNGSKEVEAMNGVAAAT